MKSIYGTLYCLQRAIERAEYVCSNYCDGIEIIVIKDAIDYIHDFMRYEDQEDINNIRAEVAELQHKNSDLEIELKAMKCAANSYKAEVERLRKGIKNLLNELTEKGTSVSLVDGHIDD